ncbi:hypothetical protein E2C01_001327 [Portunus trituberculatus]|uniref:Uncharacterized protein n=1 Tax=Portunus trituberculatus TaxID=210409 RepID=A0A5B7CMA5_PORTR|nr:hypothetical protein [Portunus trituberculatus]
MNGAAQAAFPPCVCHVIRDEGDLHTNDPRLCRMARCSPPLHEGAKKFVVLTAQKQNNAHMKQTNHLCGHWR